MAPEEPVLNDLAERMSRGEGIDWEEASRGTTDPRVRASILSLQTLERMRGFARREPDGPAGGNAESTGTIDLPPGSEAPLGRWAHLNLRAVLGRGRQGTVYLAWDPELECEVALKLNCEDRVGLGEARRLARVRHPHVVQVHGAARDGGRFGIWMEYIRGRRLSERIEEDGPLGEDEALEVGRKLASAVVAIHAVNVVHQDIKASNVMREQGGRHVLMDLGCGADLDKGQRATGGTPLYMAPEILRGGRPGKGADVYSLGVLLYHLVSGAFPYEGRDLEELRRRHREGRPRSLQELRPDLSPGFVAVVEQAIAVDRRERFPSAAALLRALEDLSARQAPARPRAEVLGRLRRRTAAAWHACGRRGRACALAALALATVGAAAWLTWPRLEVDVALQRWSGPVRQEVPDGGAVALGDILALELRGNRPLHLYAFGTDDRGGLRRLFPLLGCSLQNPLSPDALHMLPGERDGRPVGWRVTSGGGERILLLAVSSRRGRLETLSAEVPEIGVPLPGDLGPARGLGDAADLPQSSYEARRTEELLRQLREAAGAGRGTWAREIRLRGAEPGQR